MKKQLLGDKFERTTKPTIGNKYHLAWANAGCVWKLISIDPDGVHCLLETPKTKKIRKAKVEDLRLLNSDPLHPNNYKPV